MKFQKFNYSYNSINYIIPSIELIYAEITRKVHPHGAITVMFMIA